MLKEIKYNQEFRQIKTRSKYDQEYELLHDFSGGDKHNMRLEYETVQEAINARQALNVYIKRVRQPFDVRQRKQFVFVEKRDAK